MTELRNTLATAERALVAKQEKIDQMRQGFLEKEKEAISVLQAQVHDSHNAPLCSSMSTDGLKGK